MLVVATAQPACRDRLREPLHVLTPPADLVLPAEPAEASAEAAPPPAIVELARLQDLQQPLTEGELVATAASEDLRTRRLVAQRLAGNGATEPATIDAIERLARDEAAAVRFYALAALVKSASIEQRTSRMDLPEGRASAALRDLLPRLSDEDALNVVAALADSNNAYANGLLAGLMVHPAESVAVHASAALLGRAEIPLESIRAALNDAREAVSCAAARMLAYSPAPTEALPSDAVSGACYAPLLARRGDLDVLACASPARFAAAEEFNRRLCIETVLASESAEAERIVFDWLGELPDRLDAAALEELAPVARTPVADTALLRLERDPGDAIAMLAVARFGRPSHTERLRQLQVSAAAADPGLGQRYSALIDAITRRHEPL